MSWGIQCTGKPAACIDHVDAQKAYPENGDQTHINLAKETIKDMLSKLDPEQVVTVNAGGHAQVAPSEEGAPVRYQRGAAFKLEITELYNFVESSQ